MTAFLQEQIQHIFDRHKDELDEICIIIPNRRAAVYIQKYLAELIQKPFFAPEILTISEWVSKKTDKNILSSTELLFILHEVHEAIEHEQAENFEQFMLWGKTILSDFDEIAKYQIAPTTIFRNLRDIKELESWNLQPEEMGEVQRKFQQIWDKLPIYHEKLLAKLESLNATFNGQAQQAFFEQLEKNSQEHKHYFFLGFNAISGIEKSILKKMQALKKGTYAFDVDAFYYQNPEHEAGYFYRQLVNDKLVQEKLGKQFNAIPKEIEVIETSQQVGQAKIAGAKVDALLKKEEKPKDIAVVLADESLLVPLTKSLPSTIQEANITMGWPLKFSHLKGFLDIAFDFQFNFEKFNTGALYHKTLINFAQHPYTQELLAKKGLHNEIQELILGGNKIFVRLDNLLEQHPEFEVLKMLLFAWPTNNEKRIQVFEQMVQLFYTSFRDADDRRIDLEIIYQFNEGLKKFGRIVSKYEVELSIRAFRQLFFQFWQNESLSFLGNPIDGLQVMGILETRTLDFKNLVIVGMNEGNLPKSTHQQSFIPRDLRLHLGLPTEEDRQAVFAHHFYRLLHRAENIFMTYNSEGEKFGSGERSRYIAQLENEIDRDIHQWKGRTYSGGDAKANTNDIKYQSSERVRQRLDEILSGGLSPSALNKLISCPLDFYYRYILKFEEEDEVEESIESSTFGTKIHTVLERIIRDNYEKEKDVFDALEIQQLKKENTISKISERLEAAYLKLDGSKQFSKNDLKYGQNKLSFDVSRQFIGAFLDQQIKELKADKAILPLRLEESLQAEFSFEMDGKQKSITIKGLADRIDKCGDHYRIIDYKSGKCDSDKLSLGKKIMEEQNMHAFIRHEKKGYARQLLMYALMYRQQAPENKPFTAGIISMVNIKEWLQNVANEGSAFLEDELLDLFRDEMIELIRGLYDPDYEFAHNPDSLYCQHCGK